MFAKELVFNIRRYGLENALVFHLDNFCILFKNVYLLACNISEFKDVGFFLFFQQTQTQVLVQICATFNSDICQLGYPVSPVP